jgi:hypothetical protein
MRKEVDDINVFVVISVHIVFIVNFWFVSGVFMSFGT